MPGAGTGLGSGGHPAAHADPMGPSARQQRRYARAEYAGAAAATRDRFLDVIVVLSVVVFLVLALGVGLLVLQSALHG